MKVIEKISAKNQDIFGQKAVTIAFLGDSVTQGCFECYFDEKGIQTVFDGKSSYSSRLKEILYILYPSAQVNIVNAGLSGDNAINGDKRFERDIEPHKPDLVVVSFGLNDACRGADKVNEYSNAIESIFEKTKKIGAECIFVFQNMMNTKVSPFLKEEREQTLAKSLAKLQNEGVLDIYHDAAKKSAQKCGVKFCDIYSAWKKMSDSGVDTTALLSNYYNHPIRQFHYYTAIKILETMFEE